jgi:diacylglycerol kinase (ATP)
VSDSTTSPVLIVTNPTIDRPVERSLFEAAMPDDLDWDYRAPGSADEAAATLAAAADDVERLIVVGGDGMLQLAAAALCGSETTLGIIPAGTGNDAARSLGIATPERTPESMSAALKVALSPGVEVDVGLANQHPFLSVATLGFSATVNDRANRLRWPRGAASYKVATLMELPTMQAMEVTLTVDGERHELAASLIAIGNTAFFGGGMEICPSADPTDGKLDVTVIGAVGRITLLRTFPKVYEGAHVEDERVTTFRGANITLESESRQWPVWADGEPLSDTPAMFEVIPGALMVAIAAV